jgi:hypothetical protein
VAGIGAEFAGLIGEHFEKFNLGHFRWLFGVSESEIGSEEAEQGHCWQPLPAASRYFESESVLAGWVARVLSFCLKWVADSTVFIATAFSKGFFGTRF